MELSDLRVFIQVVDSGGISAAAEKLHRVPSNVTARVKSLELKMGKQLFLRDKNRLRISPAGELLLPYAKRMLQMAQETLDAISDQAPSGELRLGAMEAVAATRLVEPLMRFHKNYPQVNLEIKTAPTGNLISQVLSGDLDVAFVADPQPDDRLEQLAVFTEKLVIVSDLNYPKIECAADLNIDTTFMGFNASCAYRNKLTQWVKDGGNYIKVIEINSYHTLLSCVAGGMGIGLVPVALLDNYPFAQSLQIHPISASWSDSVTHLIWRKDAFKSSIQAFNECIEKSV
ncbi:MAG: DNA-binding transcriptional LysR family regulator [Oceanospirillaceae bacterium]